MIHISAQDLSAIQGKLDEALALHDKWREALLRNLVCRLPAPPNDLSESAHQRCAFGHWYYGKSNAHLLAWPVFGKIGELHRGMHAAARILYERRASGHLIGEEHYDRFVFALTTFRGQLLALRERVAFTLNNIDALTGVYKESQLLPALRGEQARLKESGEAYSLLLMALDVKEINRGLGREAGDRVLQATVGAIQAALSGRDSIYRLAGAEFVICLPGRTVGQAEELKETLLARIAETVAAQLGGADRSFRVDYGIVKLEPDSYLEELLKQASRLSYTLGEPHAGDDGRHGRMMEGVDGGR